MDRKNQTKKDKTVGNVWFASKEHSENYIRLLERFKARSDPKYAAACYVAAHPEIYNRVDWIESETPIGWCWGEWIGEDDYDEHGYHPESETVGQLPVSYRGLVRAAVELFTGSRHFFDLSSWLEKADDEAYRLFRQALELRRNRYVK